MNTWQTPETKKQDEVFTMPTEKPVFQGVDMAAGQDRSETLEVTQEPETAKTMTIEAQTDNPLVKFDVQQAVINQIKTYKSVVVNVDDPATVQDAKDKKKVARDLRLKVQRKEKKIDAGLVADRKALKKDANAIYTEIKPVEDHLSAEIKKDTDHKAKLAEAARIEELARVAKIDANIQILTGHCEAALVDGMTAEQITEKLNLLETTELPQEIFAEKYQDASNLLSHAVESARKNLTARVIFEEEEKKRAAELEELRKQGIINDQGAWFNKTFGLTGTLEGMENGLKTLEGMEPAEFIAGLIKQQKTQAQDIVVAARAAKADSDRLDAEKAYSDSWDEAHAINAEWVVVEPEPTRGPSKEFNEAREIPGLKTAKIQIFAGGGVVSGPKFGHVPMHSNCTFPPMDTPKKEAPTQTKESCLEKTKSILNGKLNTLRDIRESARIGDLKLILSTPDVSGVIMAESDGLQDILRAIEKTLENQVKK